MRPILVGLGPGAPVLILVLVLLLGDAGASPLSRRMVAVLLTRRGCRLSLVLRAGPASRRSTSCQRAARRAGFCWVQQCCRSVCAAAGSCSALVQPNSTNDSSFTQLLHARKPCVRLFFGLLCEAENLFCSGEILALLVVRYFCPAPTDSSASTLDYGPQASASQLNYARLFAKSGPLWPPR